MTPNTLKAKERMKKSGVGSIAWRLDCLKIDIMYPLWNFYHKWFLHKGKINWLTSCDHLNKWDILTPHRFNQQIRNIKRAMEKGEL